MAQTFVSTMTQPTRFPGGLTNVTRISPLNLLEADSEVHQFACGWGYTFPPGLPTGNTPATNADWTVTSTTTTGTASLNPDSTWPPTHLLTTGTTANDQVVIQDKRVIKVNMLTVTRKVMVAGSFRITSTVANAAVSFGLFNGTSNASLGNDQFLFNKPSGGSTLNFLNRDNAGTLQTTAVSTGILVNTLYGAVAVLDPFKLTVSVWFGPIDGFDYTLQANTPKEIPYVVTVPVTTANVPDGTNTISLGFGAQTSAGAAATVDFGPIMGVLM